MFYFIYTARNVGTNRISALSQRKAHPYMTRSTYLQRRSGLLYHQRVTLTRQQLQPDAQYTTILRPSPTQTLRMVHTIRTSNNMNTSRSRPSAVPCNNPSTKPSDHVSRHPLALNILICHRWTSIDPYVEFPI